MPALKNPRHEKFCHAYPRGVIAGHSQGAIYLAAGFTAATTHSADVMASRLLKRPDILARLAEIGAPATKAAQIDAKNLLNKFEHVYTTAKDNPDTLGHANRAAELQARMTGNLVDRHEINATFAFDELNSVEDVARMVLRDSSIDEARTLFAGLLVAMETIAAEEAENVTPPADNSPAGSPAHASNEAARAIELFRPTEKVARRRPPNS